MHACDRCHNLVLIAIILHPGLEEGPFSTKNILYGYCTSYLSNVRSIIAALSECVRLFYVSLYLNSLLMTHAIFFQLQVTYALTFDNVLYNTCVLKELVPPIIYLNFPCYLTFSCHSQVIFCAVCSWLILHTMALN